MGCIQSTCQTNNNQQQDTFSKYSSISDQVEIDESDCIKISNSNTEKSQQLIMMKKMIDDKNIFMPKLSKNSIRIPAIKVDYRKLKAKMEQEEIFRKAAAKIGFLSKLQDDDSVDDNNTDIIMVNNKIDGQKFSSAICSGIEKISPTNEKGKQKKLSTLNNDDVGGKSKLTSIKNQNVKSKLSSIKNENSKLSKLLSPKNDYCNVKKSISSINSNRSGNQSKFTPSFSNIFDVQSSSSSSFRPKHSSSLQSDSGSTQTIYTDSLSVLSSTKSIKSDFISTRSNNTISQIGRINELQKIEQQTKSHSSIEDI